MEEGSNYGIVTDAIARLRQQGFNIDFNLEGNCLARHVEEFEAQDFEIVDVYSCEGNSAPADKAVVYAIESKSGLKGTLVTGYGSCSHTVLTQILKKLQHKMFRN